MNTETKELTTGGTAELYTVYAGGDATQENHETVNHSVYVQVTQVEGDEYAEHFDTPEDARKFYDSLK